MTEDTRERGQEDRAGAVFLSGYFTAAACLNQEEWDATAADLGLDPGDQETFQCFLEAVGGPETVAAALEGTDDAESVSLYSAMMGCGLDFEGTSEPPPATSTRATTLTITVACQGRRQSGPLGRRNGGPPAWWRFAGQGELETESGDVSRLGGERVRRCPVRL